MSIQPATPPASPVRDQDVAEWEQVMQDAIEVEGYTLLGGKENERTLDALIGTPFVIRNVTFRQGDIKPKGWAHPRDYVSCEVLVRPDHAGRFPRKYLVFNDGSTGIYRQVVAALTMRGKLAPPEDLPEEGPANETRYDVSFSRESADGDWQPVSFPDLKLYCPEGLRASDYKNEDGSDGRTWYLA